MDESYHIRLAIERDIPALEALIGVSARSLQAPYYSQAQIEAALGPVFAVDRQLIHDGTYFAVDFRGMAVGCGGWSRRVAAFGGASGQELASLDPAQEPARIRAFFVHPEHARRGIGRAILLACESALCNAGYRKAMLVATLAGEPLYRACGYAAEECYELTLGNDLRLPVVRMTKSFEPNNEKATR